MKYLLPCLALACATLLPSCLQQQHLVASDLVPEMIIVTKTARATGGNEYQIYMDEPARDPKKVLADYRKRSKSVFGLLSLRREFKNMELGELKLGRPYTLNLQDGSTAYVVPLHKGTADPTTLSPRVQQLLQSGKSYSPMGLGKEALIGL